MSRSQSTSVYDTATDDSKTQQTQSQAALADAQGDISEYKDNVAKFNAANPYGDGGEAQTATNQVTANTADSTAKAYGNMLQEQAQRTGENASAANASAEAIAEQSQRDLSATQAGAVADRLKNDASYKQAGLEAGTVPISAETTLSGQQGQLSSANLNTAQGAAAANKSFWDQFGGAFATSLGSTLAGGGGGNGSTGGTAAKYLMG